MINNEEDKDEKVLFCIIICLEFRFTTTWPNDFINCCLKVLWSSVLVLLTIIKPWF